MKIVLASTSRYRIRQLKDLGLSFTAVRPLFDETAFSKQQARLQPQQRLAPRALSRYLAQQKACSLTKKLPAALIIGADQLVELDRFVLGKPGTIKRAEQQLRSMSGRTHLLHTSFCASYLNKIRTKTVTAKITLRDLSNKEIRAYVERDLPLDCAGSYKLESGGLSLVESISVSDPSSLMGLPLVSLCAMIREYLGTLPIKAIPRRTS